MKTKNVVFLPALIAVLNLIPAGRVTAQTFATLHSFTATPYPPPYGTNSDGANPQAGLILSDDTLYGTARNGGSRGAGTVFSIHTGGTGFTTLRDFEPFRLGNFTCTSGYDCRSETRSECGECVFFPWGWRCVLRSGNCPSDTHGGYPSAGLILSGNTLYGTASGHGFAPGTSFAVDPGTVFAVDRNGGNFRQLYGFGSYGSGPMAGLIKSGATLYGTTPGGGSSGAGTVFAVSTSGGGFTDLHSFTAASDGAGPVAGLITNSSGTTLYGTATGGGSSGYGTVFAVNTDGTGFTNLHHFTGVSDGANPQAGLILTGNTLYGTAAFGGDSGNGTLFALNTDGTGFTNLHSFAGYPSDGASPRAGLILSGSFLYGTASAGGSSSNGTLFALNTDGTGFTNLHSFTATSTNSSGVYTNSDGSNPQAGLILFRNTLFGTASSGGTSGNGTVFGLSLGAQLTITRSRTDLILTWPTNVAGFDYTGYRLQKANAITGPFADVPGSSSPYFIPLTSAQQFYRLVQ
jgi:uncharacterized repeat protein (TIGR03803 family)